MMRARDGRKQEVVREDVDEDVDAESNSSHSEPVFPRLGKGPGRLEESKFRFLFIHSFFLSFLGERESTCADVGVKEGVGHPSFLVSHFSFLCDCPFVSPFVAHSYFTSRPTFSQIHAINY